MSTFGYSMPSYFQNMPQIGTALNAVNEENAKSLKDIESELEAKSEAALSAGRSDESLNAAGQMTARQRVKLLVDEGTSALDQKNADLVEKSLLTNPDLTLILISHHLSAERRAQFDHVYELTPVTQ